MMKLHCDICDEVLDEGTKYYKMHNSQCYSGSISGETVLSIDVCKECYYAIEKFRKEELNHEQNV